MMKLCALACLCLRRRCVLCLVCFVMLCWCDSLRGRLRLFRICCASPAAPLGDFCADSLRGRLRVFFRTCCASPAAPLGDFCADSLRDRLWFLRTCCASPAAPLGDFCTDSPRDRLRFLRTCCAVRLHPWATSARIVLAVDFGFCALVVLVRLHP
jgi:hypothetical protein